MEFWHVWYSREAYDEFYKFAQSEDNYYNMDAINKLRLVDVSLGWSRIERIGEFARMSADQRIVHLVGRLSQQHQEFNIGYPLKEEFLRSPRAGVKLIHNEIMLMIEFDAWARFAATPAGQEIFLKPKPRLAPEAPPHAREQATAPAARPAARPPAAAPVAPAPAVPFRRPVLPASGKTLAANNSVAAPPTAPFHRPVLPANDKSMAPNDAVPPPPAPLLQAVVVVAPAGVAARAREMRNVLPAPAANAPALIIRQNVSYKGKPLPVPENPMAPAPNMPRGVPLPAPPSRQP